MEHVQPDSTMFIGPRNEDTATQIRKINEERAAADGSQTRSESRRGRSLMGGNVVAYDC